MKFQVGDLVEIVNSGLYYPTHTTAARKLKAKFWHANIGARDGEQGTIVNMWDNRENGETLFCLVRIEDKEIIISSNGIQSISEWDAEVNV